MVQPSFHPSEFSRLSNSQLVTRKARLGYGAKDFKPPHAITVGGRAYRFAEQAYDPIHGVRFVYKRRSDQRMYVHDLVTFW